MRTVITVLVLLALTGSAFADDKTAPVAQYEVTITNITKASQFTPILAATHRASIQYFELGSPASPGLALMAEDGNVALLAEELTATGKVLDAANSADVLGSPPLLFAGQSVTLTLQSPTRHARLSLAAMILPTNDSFVALDSVSLPRWGQRTYYARGYDAGSEPNDEWCANIPGPTCGGAGASPEADGEGFVHIANGIQGIGDLPSATYDWRNPIAKVVVRRVK
ncbi:MAG: spondin domain-containing protein [bacterium]